MEMDCSCEDSYGPPPVTNLRMFLDFLSFMCSLCFQSILDLFQHFARVMRTKRVYSKKNEFMDCLLVYGT